MSIIYSKTICFLKDKIQKKTMQNQYNQLSSNHHQYQLQYPAWRPTKRTRPGPGHFALLNRGEAQIDLLLSDATYFSRAFVIVYKTKLIDRIEHN